MGALGVLGWLLLGGLGWSIAEYAVHRFCFHTWRTRIRRRHEAHHQTPDDYELNARWSFFGALFILSAYTVGESPALVALGFVAGYMVYEFLHFETHAPDARLYNSALALRHREHHLDPSGNFGIVSDVWDRLLATELIR